MVCSVFGSGPADESLAGHWDAWYGAIVQIAGVKKWAIGDCLLNASGTAEDVITRAGDVLLLPKGLPHAVSTPAEPGRSVHITFAIDRDDLTGHP